MARIAPAAGVHIPGYTYGVKFATQSGNITASARSIPIQPGYNSQAAANTMIAFVAAFWNSLTPAEQAQWDLGGSDPTVAYNLFSQWNVNSLTWGMGTWDAPTALPVYDGGPIVAWVSLDDQVTTYLWVTLSGATTPANGFYLHLYNNWGVQWNGATAQAPGYTYTCSVGPLTPETDYFYDVTAIVSAYKGQWMQPISNTGAPPTALSWQLQGGYYLSDKFGRLYDTGGGPFWQILVGPYPQSDLPAPPWPLSPIQHLPPWPAR